MREDQVSQVRGYADQSPRDTEHPDAAANRRVTLVIQYLISKNAVPIPETPKDTVPAAPPGGKAESKPGTALAAPAGNQPKPSPVTAKH